MDSLIPVPLWMFIVWRLFDVVMFVGWAATIIYCFRVMRRATNTRLEDLKYIRGKVGPEIFDEAMDIGPDHPLKQGA